MEYDKNTETTDFERWKRGKCRQKRKFGGTRQWKQNQIMKKGRESDGEEGGETIEPQRRKYKNYGLTKMGIYVKQEKNG